LFVSGCAISKYWFNDSPGAAEISPVEDILDNKVSEEMSSKSARQPIRTVPAYLGPGPAHQQREVT